VSTKQNNFLVLERRTFAGRKSYSVYFANRLILITYNSKEAQWYRDQ